MSTSGPPPRPPRPGIPPGKSPYPPPPGKPPKNISNSQPRRLSESESRNSTCKWPGGAARNSPRRPRLGLYQSRWLGARPARGRAPRRHNTEPARELRVGGLAGPGRRGRAAAGDAAAWRHSGSVPVTGRGRLRPGPALSSFAGSAATLRAIDYLHTWWLTFKPELHFFELNYKT